MQRSAHLSWLPGQASSDSASAKHSSSGFRARGQVVLRQCIAEFLGTYILVFFGLGAVHVGVLTNAYAGLWPVAAVWGLAVAMVIYATSDVSGAHINPAITIAMAVYRGFPWRKIPAYIAAQVTGAFAAAATLYALFSHLIVHFEATHHIVRGEIGSELSAMIYGEYFPNPAILGVAAEAVRSVTLLQATFAEAMGTAMLAFFVLAVTERRETKRAGGPAVALFIGLGLSIIVAIIAPLTQAGFNPARDFGPRLFSYFAGWREVAIPGPRPGFFTVYILAPVIGALAGGGVFHWLIRTSLPCPADSPSPDREAGGQRRLPILTSDSAYDLIEGRTQMITRRLILVGGFLGAGKTTLLAQAAEQLALQGKRVGLITNDQAANLVDTAVLEKAGSAVREVSGGCFCCRFDDLLAATQKLITEHHPDVLIGEPVGSCTDLSATVIQPIKQMYRTDFRVAPFSVLVDPIRVQDSLSGSDLCFPGTVLYIFRKQLEEADALVLNKADVLSADELTKVVGALHAQLPGKPIFTMSALSGEGVKAWLEFVSQDRPAGQVIAEVDYDRYAEGEAALGWLNAAVRLTAEGGIDWGEFCLRLLGSMQSQLRSASAEIAHLKIHLTAGSETLTANLTSNRGTPRVQGHIVGAAKQAALLLNARVHIGPRHLRTIAEDCLQATAGESVNAFIDEIHNFAPARPQPTHRFQCVV